VHVITQAFVGVSQTRPASPQFAFDTQATQAWLVVLQ
jgi:hypothetical protein